jgi:poly(3-hydroxybutyrate) depolymerase
MTTRLLIPLLAIGCGSGKASIDTGAGLDDTGASGDSGESDGSSVAPLATLSSADCPDLTQTATSTFTSSGRDRTVTAVVPSEPTDDMPVVFFFHGLLDASMSSPSAMMASGLNLQSYADELGVVFVLPESDLMTVATFSFYMWSVNEYEGEDIVLFDDLRTCVSDQLSVDLDRVSAMGFSGGGLFTTVVARERSDTLASVVELSGGSDVVIPTFTELFAEYGTPAVQVPALLMAGGDTDVWPGGGMTLVDFSAATDTLQAQLADDGHYVVRCEHSSGHDVPYSAMMDSWDWIETHRFGEPSPFEADGIDSLTTGCDVVSAR